MSLLESKVMTAESVVDLTKKFAAKVGGKVVGVKNAKCVPVKEFNSAIPNPGI